jgi:hypothetical protein
MEIIYYNIVDLEKKEVICSIHDRSEAFKIFAEIQKANPEKHYGIYRKRKNV